MGEPIESMQPVEPMAPMEQMESPMEPIHHQNEEEEGEDHHVHVEEDHQKELHVGEGVEEEEEQQQQQIQEEIQEIDPEEQGEEVQEMEEYTIAETTPEGFTQKTIQTLQFLASQPENDLSFNTLTEDQSCKVSAGLFYELLVIRSRGLVELKQQEAYGDTVITKCETFENF